MTAATAYLVIEATRRRYGSLNEYGVRAVEAARVVAVRTNRPAKLARDQVAVRVTLNLPDSAFDPVVAKVTADVPDAQILHGPIGIEATDANGDES